MPIYNLMEDAATAEISRAQVWQWVRHGARMNDGRNVTAELVQPTIAEQLEKIPAERGRASDTKTGNYALAAKPVRGHDDDAPSSPSF